MSATMNRDVVLLIADDDTGHARLIEKNLRRAGLSNPILRFEDGQQILDFLFQRGDGQKRLADTPYLLLLDIRMPKVDGVAMKRLPDRNWPVCDALHLSTSSILPRTTTSPPCTPGPGPISTM